MNSSPVSSLQTSIHENLERLVLKHQATVYLRPIPDFSRQVFAEILNAVHQYQHSTLQTRIILDSCCGTGESMAQIAAQNPTAFVIGCDKSAHRTKRHVAHEVSNYGIWRADVEDVWRLLGAWLQENGEVEGARRLKKHFLLYPNPYPKPHHILRRWHGHPLFPTMLALADETELRTNWRIYAEEFARGASILGYAASMEEYIPQQQAMTAFERKYAASGHTLYRVVVAAGA